MRPWPTIALPLFRAKARVSLPSLSQPALYLFPLSSEKESDWSEITQLAGAAPDPRDTGQSCSPLESNPEWSLATTLASLGSRIFLSQSNEAGKRGHFSRNGGKGGLPPA